MNGNKHEGNARYLGRTATCYPWLACACECSMRVHARVCIFAFLLNRTLESASVAHLACAAEQGVRLCMRQCSLSPSFLIVYASVAVCRLLFLYLSIFSLLLLQFIRRRRMRLSEQLPTLGPRSKSARTCLRAHVADPTFPLPLIFFFLIVVILYSEEKERPK